MRLVQICFKNLNKITIITVPISFHFFVFILKTFLLGSGSRRENECGSMRDPDPQPWSPTLQSSSSRRSYFDGSGSGHPFLWLRCHQVIEIDKIDGESKKLSIRIKFQFYLNMFKMLRLIFLQQSCSPSRPFEQSCCKKN